MPEPESGLFLWGVKDTQAAGRADTARSRIAAGLLLVMSTQTAVEGMMVSTPDPAITSRTSREPGSIVMRISAPAATSASVARHCAPHCMTARSRSARASPAVTICPAATRFVHMGNPIRPTPMNPTRVTLGTLAVTVR